MNTFGILNKEYNDDPFLSGLNFAFLDAGEKRAHREI